MNKETFNKMGWMLENSYTTLPKLLYTKQDPTPVSAPNIIIFNETLAQELGLKSQYLNTPIGAELLTGNLILTDSVPIAQSYAGHQFGHFTLLGDGRAILLGEQMTPSLERYDVQLKGSGPTPYSRRGDGRATLGSMLREYIISEAMFALHIPTTRSLAVVGTGDRVRREETHAGAILTRISKGHIRVGTFQFAAMQNGNALKALTEYTVKRFYPDLLSSDNIYVALLKKVIDVQAQLIAKWQAVGFIHGVMNTDNMSIAGETIDYGPCAFMDVYHPRTVFSSIDQGGRYAYHNQPPLAQWNLARFAETLLPHLHDNQEDAIKLAENMLADFNDLYDHYWLTAMKNKLGIFNEDPDDSQLIKSLLDIMMNEQLDFTNTFLHLMNRDYQGSDAFTEWINKWHKRLAQQGEDWFSSRQLMAQHNPKVIPRNHQVEHVLKAATENDLVPLKALLSALKKPYDHTISDLYYTLPPQPSNVAYKTYCGT